jgi:hypothetical protein
MIQVCSNPSNFVAHRFFELSAWKGVLEKAQITASDSLWAIKRLVDFGLMQIIDDKVRRINGRD